MKNISLVLLAFILALTFTASDIVADKGNKPDAAEKCPFLQNLKQNNFRLQCPYLSGTEEGNSSCPYMKENDESQNGCPYLEGGSTGECPYLREKGREVLKEIEIPPLPEGKNT
jgi:hypothetical protein